VSVLALRGEYAVTFLDILEKAARSDSVAIEGERQHYLTYLRRLSYRSKKHPKIFHLRRSDTIEIPPVEQSIQCDHRSTEEAVPSLAGGCGKVYFATLKKRESKVMEVAIKTLNPSEREEMFYHEPAFWYYLNPDKVVQFIGVAVVQVENVKLSCLVSLWMKGGTICCYVDGKEKGPVRLDLLRQVAKGIKYLHGLNFVHCDIKPGNILVDTRPPQLPQALITDFGYSNLARHTDASQSHSIACGYSHGYIPPWLRDEPFARWDPQNDVYAFGITCCQVVLVNRRSGPNIARIPDDITKAIESSKKPTHRAPNREVGKDTIAQGIQKKFFPREKSRPRFINPIFDLVANTCSIPVCTMDKAIDLLEKATKLKRDEEDESAELEDELQSRLQL